MICFVPYYRNLLKLRILVLKACKTTEITAENGIFVHKAQEFVYKSAGLSPTCIKKLSSAEYFHRRF
jgi:hypothetical protein